MCNIFQKTLFYFTAGILFFSMTVIAAPDRVPCLISDDFETGELCGWEAYPYAQDIGYEPFTIPQKDPAHNNSKYSIAKIQKPNDIVELYEGFTKRLDIWTTAGTRMKCAVFLMSDRKAADLEFSICLFDGRRYFYHISNAGANSWLEMDIPISQFISEKKVLNAGEHIQAVTIKAFYPVVSQLMSYTICLDDFSINGERQRRFIAIEPVSTTFEMYGFSILNKHYFYGDTIGIKVKAEDVSGKEEVSGVTCDLTDPDGKKVAAGLPLKAVNGNWTIDKVYTMKRTDPCGQWTINFIGKGVDGQEIVWGFRFLMPGEKITPGNHPRLRFTGNELAKITADQSPRSKKLLAGFVPGPEALKNIDISGINETKTEPREALTGGPYSIISEGETWWAPIKKLGRIITNGSTRYAFAGDKAAGLKAKEAMLKLCGFSLWNHPWQEAHGNHTYYPECYHAVGPIGEAYDLIYPLLSEDDKQYIRTALMNNALKPFYRDMVELNRMPSSLSNHIAVIVTGMVKATVAIYGEDPQNPYMEPYLSGILAKTKQFIDRTYYPDGGYGEPTTYQDMASRDLVEALDILEKNFGIDYTTTTYLKDTWLYPLYVTYSDGRYPDFGDVSPIYDLNGDVFRWLSYRTKNPLTYSFIQKDDEADKGGLNGLLWKTEGVVPKNRSELIPSHMFPVKGNMVMRSGWSDDSVVMIFKSGPNSNHYHVDQGTFYLMANGEELITDAGHGSSYYANPFYSCYYTQPIGHNVMLIDNDAESQIPADYENGITALRDYPGMPHSFAGWNYDEAEGNLTCVYKGKLDNYTRSFLYIKPDILFLYDKVKSPAPHRFSWLFHAEHTDGKSSITGGKDSIDITRTKSSLHMDILSPAILSSRIRNSDRDESFITLSGAPGTTDTDFLAALFPKATKDAVGASDKPVSTLLNPEGWIGAKVEKSGTVTLAMFRKGAAGNVTAEGFTTDAERFSTVVDSKGNLTSYFLRGSLFGIAGNTLFRSAGQLSVSAMYVAGGMDIETESESGTEINLYTEKAPASLVVNGVAVKGFKYDRKAGVLKVIVPAGHTTVKVRNNVSGLK